MKHKGDFFESKTPYINDKSEAVMVLTLIAAMAFSRMVFANVHVSGYQRADGTYVQAHDRSDPDGTTDNNWSHKGNVNPETGKAGHDND
jgi:hypothetical protein